MTVFCVGLGGNIFAASLLKARFLYPTVLSVKSKTPVWTGHRQSSYPGRERQGKQLCSSFETIEGDTVTVKKFWIIQISKTKQKSVVPPGASRNPHSFQKPAGLGAVCYLARWGGEEGGRKERRE